MPCDLFDPADWLERFEAMGGWYAVRGDHVHAGWRMEGMEEAEAAREIWREIEHDEARRAAIRATVRDGL